MHSSHVYHVSYGHKSRKSASEWIKSIGSSWTIHQTSMVTAFGKKIPHTIGSIREYRYVEIRKSSIFNWRRAEYWISVTIAIIKSVECKRPINRQIGLDELDSLTSRVMVQCFHISVSYAILSILVIGKRYDSETMPKCVGHEWFETT